uniref:Plant heme peroxidase family profile domain-containing protein n=1 Tax=Aegilops tauschii TaxID=37682 RepID=M8BVY1_AEGTA
MVLEGPREQQHQDPEAPWPGVFSCANILALALGGPYWDVRLSRRDLKTANRSLANVNLPSAGSSLDKGSRRLT